MLKSNIKPLLTKEKAQNVFESIWKKSVCFQVLFLQFPSKPHKKISG